MECWMHSPAKGQVGGQYALPKAKACGVGVRGCALGKPGINGQDRGHFLHLPSLPCRLSILSALSELFILTCFLASATLLLRHIRFAGPVYHQEFLQPSLLTAHPFQRALPMKNLCRKAKKDRRLVGAPGHSPNCSLFDTCIECMNAPAANLRDSQTSPTRLCASFTTILLAQSRANEAKQATDAGSEGKWRQRH